MRTTKRILGIDIFRGWAILLMLFFHIVFDLQYFHMIDFHIQSSLFFRWLRFLIVSMFLLTVGMSLKFTHKKEINWLKLKKRTLYLGLSSIIVTTTSYFLFPTTWIYFGILHFILLVSFILLPFLNRPYLALFIATAIFITFHMDILNMHWLFNFIQPYFHLPTVSVDVLRFFPWVSPVLFGMALVTLNWHKKIFNHDFFNRESVINRFFAQMGRNGLLIYMIHQPLFFAIFLLIKG